MDNMEGIIVQNINGNIQSLRVDIKTSKEETKGKFEEVYFYIDD